MKDLLFCLFIVVSYQSTDSIKPFFLSGSISKSRDSPATLRISLESVRTERDVDFVDKQFIRKPRRLLKKYKQTWHGLEVWGFGATYRENPDELITAKFAEDIEKDIATARPRIKIDKAMKTAFKNRLSKDKNVITKFQPDHPDDSHSKLMVYIDPKSRKARLVYRMQFLVVRQSPNKTELTNAFVKMNAMNGKILDVYENLVSLQMTGDGGNIKIGKYKYGEGFYANKFLEVTKKGRKCQSSNPLAMVSNAENIFFFPTNLCFEIQGPYKEKCDPKSPNSDATNNSYSQVHDALYFATTFVEMLETFFGDTTLQECCGQLRLCVLYNHTGFSFYLNSSNCETYYGLGGDFTLDMATSTIIGHELGHALIACTSNMEYKCQPGAIVESFADLCGIMSKAFLNNFQTDWQIGAEVIRTEGTSSTAIRFMDDPPLDGRSIDCTKDYDCQEVHQDNGIYNKGIYNLYSMEGWDLIKVFEIFLRATKFYWKEITSFDEGLCDLMHAATDFGYNPADVADAFAKVGVFCGCPEGWVTRIDGADDFGHGRTTCFKFVNQTASWAEASAYCQSMKSQLVVVDDFFKAQFIYNNAFPNNDYWLAGSDLKTEGVWEWLHAGVGVVWTDWTDYIPPSQNTQKNCMSMTSTTTEIGELSWGWKDENCDTRQHFICELGCCGRSCWKP